MIEVFVLIKPLLGNSLFNDDLSSVNRSEVLHSSHVTDESMSWLCDICIFFDNTKREPSLFDLWVSSVCNVQGFINFWKEFRSKICLVLIAQLFNQLFQEDDFDITIRTIIPCLIFLINRIFPSEKIVSKILSWGQISSCEVKSRVLWNTWMLNPIFPVNLILDFCMIILKSFFDVHVEGQNEILVNNGSLWVSFNMQLKKVLHVVFSNNRFSVVKKLESLLVWNLAEGAIGRVAAN